MAITHSVLLASLALLTPAASAQGLLADLNQIPAGNPSSISSSGPVASGTRAFFAAADRLHGEEVWVTDGTAPGTRMVADLAEGRAGSTPRALTAFAGGAAFTVGALRALFHTDGTAAGTRQLCSASLGLDDPVAVGNRLFFAANGGGVGQELWSSDGTPNGTALVKDIRAGSGWSEPRQMVAWQGKLWFLASDGAGARLWSSDGTAAGTVEVAPGVAYGVPHELIAATNALFFATVGNGGGELWRSDGTSAGTTLVRGGFATVPYPTNLAAFGALVLFTADDGFIGPEAWRSDGTAGGTFSVGDIYPGSGPSPYGVPRAFTVVGNQAFFSADDGLHGHELWVTDATVSGTRPVADIRPGVDSSLPQGLRAVGGRFYFTADDGVHGTEPWFSDGTASGTQLLRDIRPGESSYSSSVTPVGGNLLFAATDGVHGREPWISDGTTAGTSMLLDIEAGVGHGEPEWFTRYGRRFVFVADDGVHGREPWISDGTAAGTTMLRDLAVGPSQSYARDFVSWQGRLWFAAYDANGDSEPWVSDGTTASTTQFADLVPGNVGSRPLSFTPLDGRMVFIAGALVDGQELWTTDGTVAGTSPIDLDPTLAASPRELVRAGERAFFTASESVHGTELWVTDGTPAGTNLVADLVPGIGSSQLTFLTAVGDRLFFQGAVLFQPFPVDVELWTSDGTAAGTVKVADIVPGLGSSRPTSLVAWRDRVWFFVEVGLFATELWSSDGTAAGTGAVVGSITPTGDLVAAGDLLFFAAGEELWRSDGTTAGTFPVTIAGATVTAVSAVAAAGDGTRVVFAATAVGKGAEPWVSDGTTAGTVPLAELWSGPDGSSPAFAATVGSYLAFAADDGVHGIEPFVLPLTAIAASLAQPFGAPCPGTLGEPRIGALQAPSVGAPGFALTLFSARPSAPAVCAFGTDVAPGAELIPCAPAITGTTVAVVLGTDPSGQVTLPVPVPPSPALVGAHLYAQFVVVDPQGGFLGFLAFSDLLDLLIGG